MENSKISWCDHTSNFWIGCTKVSPACENCYAETLMDKRFHRVQWGAGKPRVERLEAARAECLKWERKAVKTGVRPHVFVNSLSDWLDPEVPIAWLAFLLETILLCPTLDFLLLTKRPENFGDRLRNFTAIHYGESLAWMCAKWLDGEVPTNVWGGATVENQEQADNRIPELLKIPARVRFLSCEPLLGPIDLQHVYMIGGGSAVSVNPLTGARNNGPSMALLTGGPMYYPKINWVICGGESGPNARPMHPDWARSLRVQCKAAGVPFFFKQWGEWVRCGMVEDETQYQRQVLEGTIMCKVGMMAAGKLIDGDLDPVNHHEFPEGGPRE